MRWWRILSQMGLNYESELLADAAVGIEQQLIELVNRRDAILRRGMSAPELDAEIEELQEALGELTERLSPA